MAHNPANIMNLNILAFNCQSIRNKILEIDNHIAQENIDIALFSETWLSRNHKLYFNNFTTYRTDRANGLHGGVALSIKNTITHTQLPVLNTKVIETVGIKIISPTNQIIFIISCYFPGSNNPITLQEFKQDIIYLTSFTNCNFFLVGDFNAKHRLWNNVRANKAGQILHHEMSRRQFVIHHSPTATYYPTQARATSPSTIDICISNTNFQLSQINSQSALSSDHNPITFTIHCTAPTNPPKTVLRFDKTDWKQYKIYIANNTDLSHEITGIDDIEEEIEIFTRTLLNAKDTFVPKSKVSLHQNPLPLEIKRKITYRNYIRRQWQRTRCPNTRSVLNSINREIRIDCINSRNSLFNDKMLKLEKASKKFWQVTKIIKNKCSIMPPLRDTTAGVLVTSPSEKANLIASSFARAHLTTHNLNSPSVDNLVIQSVNYLNNAPTDLRECYRFHTKPSEVHSIIKFTKNKKSPGLDNINNILLKNIPKKSYVKLTKIINACISFSYFPTTWKLAKVIPLTKVGKDNTLPNNYRPISLLSSISKILERIILNRLSLHIEDSNIIPDVQFGFRRGHATVHQLARVVGDLKKAQNEKESTGLITIDIEKAFDSVWHAGLLHKLLTMNFPITLCKFISSFLKDRKFLVYLAGVTSNTHSIVAGLPQGSCLSPVLYNIFTADLPISNTVNIALFADDTALYCSSCDPKFIIHELEIELLKINTFFTTWKIKINEEKTQAMFLTRRRSQQFLPDRKIRLSNKEIDWKNELKYLGLILDKKLTFQKHTEYSNERSQKYIKILYPLINRKSDLSIQNKMLIFKCIFRPMLLYAGEVWGDCAVTHTKSIQVSQNKLIKLIFKLPYFYSTERLHTISNTNTIDNSLTLMKHKFIQKCQHSENTLIQSLFT